MALKKKPKAPRRSRLSPAIAVILAGGIGSRLWPISDQNRPKQFQIFFGRRSLLQHTFDRLTGIFRPDRILVITREDWLAQAKKQLPRLPRSNFVGEPLSRDTAPAVCLATLYAQARFGPSTLAFFPADHWVDPARAFQLTIGAALESARQSPHLYLVGIQPDHPAVEYGYLRQGAALTAGSAISTFALESFHEKPDMQKAQEFVRSGKYFWNSGIFIGQSAVFAEEFQKYLPACVKTLAPLYAGRKKPSEISLKKAYAVLAPISLDYAVIEKSQRLRMILSGSHFTWSDLGSWDALRPFLKKDVANNSFNNRLQASDAAGNLLFSSDSNEEMLLLGVDDLVVVRAKDKTFITRRERLADLKQFIQEIKRK